ncbi:IS21 family transposase, partial [Escherichia coli]|nr:IS21 family transposase [Escherichia coli]
METCFKVLQLKFDRKLSNRTIGLTLNISPSTVFEVLARFKASSTPWPLPETLTPEAIESLIFPEKKASVLIPVLPDWLHIDT